MEVAAVAAAVAVGGALVPGQCSKIHNLYHHHHHHYDLWMHEMSETRHVINIGARSSSFSRDSVLDMCTCEHKEFLRTRDHLAPSSGTLPDTQIGGA